MAIRNTFNPERFRGRSGFLTIEEASRLQDLIKGAGDAYTRQINQILQQFNVTVTNVTAAPGAQGARGIPGQDGDDGEPGPPGRQGVDGAAGPQGPTGPRGLSGDDGVDGDPGVPGPAGPQGVQGPIGAAGPRGLNGDDGADGLDSMVPGPPGAAGASGAMGPPGADGEPGEEMSGPGSAASLARARFWVSSPDPSVPNAVNIGALAAGVLQIAVSGGVATPSTFTWPSAGLVLYSTGATSAPDAQPGFAYDTGADQVSLSGSTPLTAYNLGSRNGDANYERVFHGFVANVYTIKSQKNGTGTLRSMKIDADTATLTANGDTLTLTATTTMNVGTLATTPTINVLANTSIFIAAGTAITSPHPSSSFASSQLQFSTSIPSQAANVATAWDGIRVSGDCSLTGTGTVTTPVSSWTFSAPTITGTGVGATVTDAATVRIVGAPVGSGLTVNLSAALWVQAGATRIEGDLVLPAVANGSVATVLGSLGPAGSHTTVQKWFVWKDTSGTAYYVPGF